MDTFDARANEWDHNPRHRERAERIAAAIRRCVPLRPTMTALEYGCGTGLLSFALRDDLGAVTLADSSDGMLAVVRRKLAADAGADHMTAMKLDLETDPLPPQRYDLILCQMVLHHVSDVDAMLARFYELLNPGGALCAADLDKEDGSFHGADFHGHHGFDRQDLAARVTRAGFAPPEFADAFQMQRNVGDREEVFSLFLMVARKA